MNEVFRFLQHRKPLHNRRLPVPETPSDLIRDLQAEAKGKKSQYVEIVEKRVLQPGGGYFLTDREREAFEKWKTVLEGARDRDHLKTQALLRGIEQHFSQPATEYLKSQPFKASFSRVYDALIAAKISPRYRSSISLEALQDTYKLMGLALLAVDPKAPDVFRFWSRSVIVLPASIFPLQYARSTESRQSAAPKSRNLPMNEDFSMAEAESALRVLARLTDNDMVKMKGTMPAGATKAAPKAAPKERSAARSMGKAAGFDTPMMGPAVNMILSKQTLQQFPAGIRKVIETHFAEDMRAPESVAAYIESEIGRRQRDVAAEEAQSIFRLGKQNYVGALTGAAAGVPTSVGSIKAAGIADLLMVKEQLKAYEAAEVAHIENVLRGESKKRQHRSLNRAEQSFTTEVEQSQTDSNEHNSTERFELTKESEKISKMDAGMSAGLTVSASYGPMVEVTASLEGNLQTSTTQTDNLASSYAKEVTDRAKTEITKRELTRQVTTILNETEEINAHELNNLAGSGHTIGVYQWVDKVYEAQVFRYGLRTLFDFSVAEPAAFYIHAQQNSPATPDLGAPPIPFTLTPAQLDRTNYHTYVQRYGAQGVKPPPTTFRSLGVSFTDRSPSGDRHSSVASSKVMIPEGYYVQSIRGGCHPVFLAPESSVSIRFTVGGTTGIFDEGHWSGAWNMATTAQGELAVAVSAFQFVQYAMSLQFVCALTDEGYQKWKLETHEAITAAYMKQKMDYEQKLAGQSISAGVAITGRNPGTNQTIIKDELKKSCLTVLTNQHYDEFDAIDTGTMGFPQMDVQEAMNEGAYIRFFEQAFEWEHMMYLFYPYFWSRKNTWLERMSYDDVDPKFLEFLKAGSARVVVPVRLGFESAVQHFLDTGEIWNGEGLPGVGSDAYVDITQETMARQDALLEAEAIGEPWEVRLPTSLVRLRQSSQLPVWEKQGDTWHQLPEPQGEISGATPLLMDTTGEDEEMRLVHTHHGSGEIHQ